MKNNMKNWWLYVLRLEHGKYYVGVTSKADPQERIRQHGKFASAAWTREHKPLETIELEKIGFMTYEEAEIIEDKKLKTYMQEYGHKNVRGGSIRFVEDSVKIGVRFWKKEDFKDMLFSFAAIIMLFIFVVLYLVK